MEHSDLVGKDLSSNPEWDLTDPNGEPRNPVIHRSHCSGQFLVPQLAIVRHKRWLYGKQLRSSRCLRIESGRGFWRPQSGYGFW